MPTENEALHRLLMECSLEDRLASGVAAALQPFFAAASTSYDLRSEPEITARYLQDALAAAIGRPVRGLVFIGELHPSKRNRPRPLWVLQGEAVRPDRRVREDHFQVSLADVLRSRLGAAAEFWGSHGSLKRAGSALLRHLWPELRTKLNRGQSRVLNAAARDNVWVSLTYYLGFASDGNAGVAAELRPLLAFLPYAVPIGESIQDPGVWYVQVAGGI